MYFDFEDRRFDTPTIESAMSWRERSLLALFAHLLVAVLVLLVPQLQFVQDSIARRAELVTEVVEAQRLARLEEARTEPEFIFVEPLVDLQVPEPAPGASLSDIDRVAQSPFQAEIPINDLPNSDGNTSEFIESEVPSEVPGSSPDSSNELEAARTASRETVDGLAEAGVSDPLTNDDNELGNSLLAGGVDASREISPVENGGPILNQALRGLDDIARNQTFHNLSGRTDRYGDDIQFDSKGVDFGSWLRRFRAQIYRNWFVPLAAMSMSGNVILTFNVHDDGALTDLTVQRPSTVDAFTNSAYNALRGSNPTQPLPPEYPDDQVFFTVTFYFNQPPPHR